VNTRGVRLELRARVDLGDYAADAVWSPDGRHLVAAGGQGALLWIDVTAPDAPAQRLGEHAGGALALAWQGGGRLLASSGQDGEVRLWDLRTREARVIHAAPEWSECLAFASHGRLLAVGTGRALRVFDGTGKLLEQPPPQGGVIAALAWRAKTSELAAVGNGGMRLYRLEPQLQVREFAMPGACLTASFSPDGRVLAAGTQDGAVQYWNIAATTQSQLRGYGTKVALTSWSSNSRYLATAADQQIVVWDFTGTGPQDRAPQELTAHTARLTQLAFQPQGLLLAAAARDRRITLWRTAQPQQPVDACLLGDEVALLRWSNDGRQLVAADRNGVLSLYALAS
jgi:WD40 repeat protein